MAHPTTRVLAVLELLQSHGRISGTDMAQRLQVDVRTLRRYIATLEEIGVPITAERGRFGAYCLVPGFKLPPMMFTDDEAIALSVGLLAARGLGLADAAPAVASAQAKLERVLPANLKRRLRAVDETVTLDFGSVAHPGDNRALATLSLAAQAQQRVHLRYRPPRGEPTARDFDPYGLAYREGRWYVVGLCHLRAGVRSFRLDRIDAVDTRPASFGRPPGFDAAAHLAQSLATLPRTVACEVVLATDLATARKEIHASLGIFATTADGVRMRSQVDDLDWFARVLARLPFDFRVVSPDDLRGALKTLAKRLQRIARTETEGIERR
jgi:predicted DNA-binding transcriptional regulator YafY